MKKCEDVAVVIVNYNGFEDSVECIKSVIETGVDSKIVFIDNASKINEADEIKQLFKDVECIRVNNNYGYSAGCNIGIRYALLHNYKYVLILNNDTIIDKEMIYILRDKADKKVISVPKMLYYSEPNVIWYGGGKIDKKTGNAKNLKMNFKDDSETEVQQCTFATGCCLMLSMATINAIGMLDESFFMYCEDEEYSLRALKNNIEIIYVPTAKLWHKVSKSTGGSESAFCFYYLTRNILKCINEYKDYFRTGATLYTILSRYIRAIQYKLKGNKNCNAFLKGIHDYKQRKYGRRENIV